MTLQGRIVVALLLGLPAVFARTAARAGHPKGPRDRCALLTRVGGSAVALAIGRALVPWDLVPPALWGAAAAITAWAVITAVRAWPQMPTVVGRRPRLRRVTSGLGLGLGAALVVIFI